MGSRGPLPVPTPILAARGSWLAPLRAGEVCFDQSPPACPAWLDKEGKAEWRRQVKQLDKAGILQIVDRAILASWCEAWSELSLLKKQIARRTTGEGGEELDLDSAGRLVRLKNAAVERLLRIAQHFGFSAATRARIRAGDDKPVADPFEDYLNRKGA